MAMQDLQKAQAELDDKEAELDKVQAEYEQAMTEKQVIIVWAWEGPSHTYMHGCATPFVPFLLSHSKGLVFDRVLFNL